MTPFAGDLLLRRQIPQTTDLFAAGVDLQAQTDVVDACARSCARRQTGLSPSSPWRLRADCGAKHSALLFILACCKKSTCARLEHDVEMHGGRACHLLYRQRYRQTRVLC